MTLPDMDVYGEIMQQADASALRLFEALVVTLPQTLLQTYVLICTDIGVKSPGEHFHQVAFGNVLEFSSSKLVVNF